ncbi:hypothetical protein [Polaromonas sp. LjRoot131]|uniref:hypothetical protein n=1 Tax=Polaromonas sp. LjRoot131 TaxID=3342262 RepID=UPI003ECF6278
MPIDTAPEGAELLHQPVVKPFPEISPKHPHHVHHAEGDGHNHDDDDGAPPGISSGAGQNPGLVPPPG